jgi:hypothetical protein
MVDPFRSRAASSRIRQLGRRYSLAAQRAQHDARLRLRSARQRVRLWISAKRDAALLAWERAHERTRDVILGLIVGGVSSLILFGYWQATEADLQPFLPLGRSVHGRDERQRGSLRGHRF